MQKSQLIKTLEIASPKRAIPQLSRDEWQKLKSLSEVILSILAVAGSISLAVLAPNMFKVLPSFYKRKGYKHQPTDAEIRQKLYHAFHYLKASGKIMMKADKVGLKVWLTSLGKRDKEVLDFERMAIQRPKHWNRRWWQVAADIPTKKHKHGADMLRWKLKNMKFYSLQRTLWFYPFDPRKELDLIIRRYGIEKFVTVMEINRLDKADERLLKSHFYKEAIL